MSDGDKQDQRGTVPKDVRDELYSAVEDDEVWTVLDIVKQYPGILTNYSSKHFSWYLHLACMYNRQNICHQMLELGSDVNKDNDDGDTPLHVALNNEADTEIIQILIDHGADVFKQNHQGASSFLLSCMLGSFVTFNNILKCKNLPKPHTDIYHQNGLHLLFKNWSKLDECGVLSTSIELLLQHGVNVNDKDCNGRTVLHHASYQRAFKIIPHLIELGADPCIKDNYGESFLTKLEDQCSTGELSELLPLVINSLQIRTHPTEEGTEIDGKETVLQFLNFTNLTGKSLLHIFVPSMDTETLKFLLEKGANVNLQDNLGKTPLHECGRMSNEREKIELLLKYGARLDTRDICKRIPLFEVADANTAEVLLMRGSEANVRDKIGLSPLHVAILDCHEDIVDILIKHGASVNSTDNHGSTALHFAAWFGFSEVLRILKRCGADETVQDKNGYIPHQICQELEKSNPKQMLQKEREGTEMSIGDRESKKVRLGNKSVNDFAAFLLSTPRLGLLKYVGENAHIKDIVYDLLEKVVTHVVMLDGDFQGRLFITGSSAEGTRVGEPNEFDCLYLLDKLGESCDIFENGIYLLEGFVELKAKHVIDVNPNFFDRNGFLDGGDLKDKLSHLVKIAVHQTQMWNSNELYEIMVTVDCTKPVINLEVRYIGNYYKCLDISIDIVPAVYKQGWWPSHIKTKSQNLLCEKVENAGCAVLIQNPGIELDCEDVDHFMRISSSPAEIALFQLFPAYIKQSYALVKVLLSENVSPSIPDQGVIKEVDFFPADNYISSYMIKNCLLHEVSKMSEDFLAKMLFDSRPETLGLTRDEEIIFSRKPLKRNIIEKEANITSSNEKTNFYHMTEEDERVDVYENDLMDITESVELAKKVIVRLQTCIEKGNLPAYFFPSINIFGHEYRTIYGEDVDKEKESIEQKKDQRLKVTSMLLKMLEE